MSRRNLNARQPAKNISAAPPTRKTMVGGVVVTEKVAPLWGYKMVAPDGDVVLVTLSSGFTIRGLKGNEHGVQKLAEKEAAGFLRFSECPVATRKVKREDFGPPCDAEFSDAKCCPHLEKIMLDRRAAHRASQLEHGQKFETQQDRMVALLERQAAASVSERQAPQAGKKAPIGG